MDQNKIENQIKKTSNNPIGQRKDKYQDYRSRRKEVMEQLEARQKREREDLEKSISQQRKALRTRHEREKNEAIEQLGHYEPARKKKKTITTMTVKLSIPTPVTPKIKKVSSDTNIIYHSTPNFVIVPLLKRPVINSPIGTQIEPPTIDAQTEPPTIDLNNNLEYEPLVFDSKTDLTLPL
jgi:hypothetical protein